MGRAKIEKLTTSTGCKIGLKNGEKIYLAVNDEDRILSRQLEIIKKHDSKQKISAAETYRRILMRGITHIIEDMLLASQKETEKERQSLQMDMFSSLE